MIFNLRDKRNITSECWENGDIGILSKTMRKWCIREVSLELLFFLPVNLDQKKKTCALWS